jgi:hypothetical protein
MNTSIYKRQWDVGSFTDPGKKPYKISERLDGGWECSCPAWTRHMPRADCKHIDKVRRALQRTPAAPAFISANQPTSSVAPTAPSPRRSQPATAQATAAPEITFEGYTIRRRARLDFVEVGATDDDTLTSTNTDPTCELTTRGRREI